MAASDNKWARVKIQENSRDISPRDIRTPKKREKQQESRLQTIQRKAKQKG